MISYIEIIYFFSFIGGAAVQPGPQPPVFDHVHAAAAVAGAAVANHNLQQVSQIFSSKILH